MGELFHIDYHGPGLAGVDEVGRGPLAGAVVAAAVIDTLSALDLAYPTVSADKLKNLAAAKRSLLGER